MRREGTLGRMNGAGDVLERGYGHVFLCVYRSWRMENHPLPYQEKKEGRDEERPKRRTDVPYHGLVPGVGEHIGWRLGPESNTIPGDKGKQASNQERKKESAKPIHDLFSFSTSLSLIQSTNYTVVLVMAHAAIGDRPLAAALCLVDAARGSSMSLYSLQLIGSPEAPSFGRRCHESEQSAATATATY